MKILAVTACPTGIAYTYMAAEAVRTSCKKAGIECKVETQGFIGRDNVITEEDVESADAVILTTDMPIEGVSRFDNLPKKEVTINELVKQSDAIVAGIAETVEFQK